jgi:hypothetical protein
MSLLFYYSYLFRIDKTSYLFSYLNIIRSAFIFNNIRIRIRIHFKNMKTDMEKALPAPHPIHFHP